LDRHIFNESEMALFYECTDGYAQKVLDTADIVRDAIYQQLRRRTDQVAAGSPGRAGSMHVQGSLTAAPNQSVLVRNGSSPDRERQSDPADLPE
jgi:hypothetical protein